MIINCYVYKKYYQCLSSCFLKIDIEVALTILYGREFQMLIVCTPKKFKQALRWAKGLYSV